MDHPCVLGFFLIGTLYFGALLRGLIPILTRLLAAILRGAVKWPGPIVHGPDPKVNLGRLRAGLAPDRLFPEFIFFTLGLAGAFVFSLSMFLAGTPLLSGYVFIRWSWVVPVVGFFAFIGGVIGSRRAMYHKNQVEILLANLDGGGEPRQVEGSTAEAEYAIDHPLMGRKSMESGLAGALARFCEGTKYFQLGNRRAAMMLYQEAMEMDPSLHEHAREALSTLADDCSPEDAGPIHYWIGAHSEYLTDLKQAAAGYEKAIQAFREMGYPKRESRAHCNLGNVKLMMHDASGMDEFKKAIELNPRNGTAHLNIARTYYSISGPGSGNHELALDEFAEAIAADPLAYGPVVIASLRELGYTWREDLEKITQRVERKQR